MNTAQTTALETITEQFNALNADCEGKTQQLATLTQQNAALLDEIAANAQTVAEATNRVQAAEQAMRDAQTGAGADAVNAAQAQAVAALAERDTARAEVARLQAILDAIDAAQGQ